MAGQDRLPKSHDGKYLSTMRRIIKNADLWTLADRLSDALMQDPSMSSLLQIYVNPPFKRERKQRMAHLNKDPCLKLILDEIENGGPAVMMRYWNDEKVLKMFGLAMKIPLVASSENSRLRETENMGNEGEPIVHHIGDIELCCSDLKEPASNRVSPQSSSKYKCKQIEITREEHSLVVLMLKLNLVDLLFRRKPRVPLPYYWDGYVRTHSGNSGVKSSASTHNLPDQETQGAGKDGLLTILTRVMSETPSARFAQEFVLVLFLYHCLCTMPSDQFDKEDPASFVNPFNFSSLLYDPNIKKFAEHVEKYPSFNQMAGQDGLPKSHDQEYLSAMTQIMNNVDLWTLTDRLCHALMQDPSMSSLLEIYANPSLRRKRKQETAHFNQDPCLKLILDEIENGGPAVMMRYWNDEKVLKMFGLVMGIPLVASENSRLLETENEDESIVHHTAIIRDVKLRCSDLKELASNRVSPQLSSKYKCNQIESTDEEHSLVVLMLKLNLVDLLFRRKPPVPLPYYWDGYVRTHSGNSRVKSSASTHNLPDQETQGAGKDGLLTILTRVMSETPSTRFVQEFVLVLFLYHCLCTMPSDQFDIEDPVKKAVKLFAREKEYWESLEAE